MVLRMMLGVNFISHDRFILHRFLTDAAGHFIGSYLSVLATYGIDPHSDRPIDFNHGFALVLAATFILSDFVIARFFGNKKWFGLVSLLAASILGYMLLPIGAELYLALTDPLYSVLDRAGSLVGLVGLSPLFLIPALLFPLVIRLMAYPIIRVFRPSWRAEHERQ
ncbi:MAG: hypothetical protein ABI857_13630 [Acidobacteriota bacterium]